MAAAVVAARHNKAKKRPAVATSKVTAERIKAKQDELKRRAEIQELFLKYDAKMNGKLDDGELKKMLTDLDTSTPPGTEPSDEEVKFIMSVADWDASGKIEKSEISYVISAWRILTAKRSQLVDVLKEFDKEGNGQLSKEELTAYLTKLNEGIPVSSEEADWVYAQADVLGDGAIKGPEIVMASAAWFAYVEDHAVVHAEATNAMRGSILVAEEKKIRETFRKWDCGNAGVISVSDLTTILGKVGVTGPQIQALFQAMDADKDGKVSYEEFINYIFSDVVGADTAAAAAGVR